MTQQPPTGAPDAANSSNDNKHALSAALASRKLRSRRCWAHFSALGRPLAPFGSCGCLSGFA
eukprot:5277814-Alexandrium_andersonii.AAC.1